MRRFTTPLLLAAFMLAGAVVPGSVRAHEEDICFNVPRITNCIDERFRHYWEQNGGLAVFGYPLSPAQDELNRDTGRTHVTQWFERARFELHPENQAPYDVLLGRLGEQQLARAGRAWQGLPRGQPAAGCLWFAQTGHAVCDQEPGVGFKSYWENHGLNDPILSRFEQSLALFGLPLSEPTRETNAVGATVVTQWFERARFEYHPDKPREFKVLLGLLGNETRAGASSPPDTRTPGLAIVQQAVHIGGEYSYNIVGEVRNDTAGNVQGVTITATTDTRAWSGVARYELQAEAHRP